MENQIKSGKEILDNFFQNMKNLSDVDEKIAEKLCELYNQGKLTNINITNALINLRNDNGSNKN